MTFKYFIYFIYNFKLLKILYIHTYHVDYFIIHKSFYEKKNQDIIIVQMYEIVNIQMHFQSNYLTFWFF